MRLAWFGGLATVLLFVLAAALSTGPKGVVVFLVVAPLVPVAGVAASYGPSADPTYEASAATPYPWLRLVLFRTGAVLSTAVPVVVVAGILQPAHTISAAWLLPAVGFVAVVLLAGTWVDPVPAAVVVSAAWSLTVVSAAFAGEAERVLDPEALVGYALLTVAAALALTLRLRALGARWRRD
jgi:hypothetical protein